MYFVLSRRELLSVSAKMSTNAESEHAVTESQDDSICPEFRPNSNATDNPHSLLSQME